MPLFLVTPDEIPHSIGKRLGKTLLVFIACNDIHFLECITLLYFFIVNHSEMIDDNEFIIVSTKTRCVISKEILLDLTILFSRRELITEYNIA